MVRDVYEQKPKDDEKNEKRFQVIIQEIQDGIEKWKSIYFTDYVHWTTLVHQEREYTNEVKDAPLESFMNCSVSAKDVLVDYTLYYKPLNSEEFCKLIDKLE